MATPGTTKQESIDNATMAIKVRLTRGRGDRRRPTQSPEGQRDAGRSQSLALAAGAGAGAGACRR